MNQAMARNTDISEEVMEHLARQIIQTRLFLNQRVKGDRNHPAHHQRGTNLGGIWISMCTGHPRFHSRRTRTRTPQDRTYPCRVRVYTAHSNPRVCTTTAKMHDLSSPGMLILFGNSHLSVSRSLSAIEALVLGEIRNKVSSWRV
jgi:hypothetical protein